MGVATDIVLRAKGVDQASSIFKKIGSVLAALAIPAALGKAIKDLGNLSDVAMRASMSTEDLTQMSSAMGELGIKGSDIENIAQAMQYMQKNVGEVGKAGFEKVVNEIARIESVEGRAQAAMAAFGRSGLNYLPLIEQAARDGGFEFDQLARTMPAVSQGAADVGDAFADSIGQVATWAKTHFLNAVGEMLSVFNGFFDGGIRTAVSKGLAHIDSFVAKFKAVFSDLGSAFYEFFDGDLFAFNRLGDEISASFEMIDRETEKRLADIDAIKDKRANLAIGSASGGIDLSRDGAASAASMRNELMTSGSYSALTFSLRKEMSNDPLLRATREQTSILKKIHAGIESQKQVEALGVIGG